MTHLPAAERPEVADTAQARDRIAREIAIEALDMYIVGKRPEDLEGALHQIIYVLRDGGAE